MKKDMFTLFREGGRGLSVKPSPRAWQRLENRLDLQKRRGRILSFRWLTAVAASVVLLAAVSGFFFFNYLENRDGYSQRKGPLPVLLENLDGSAGCQPYCFVIQARKELPAEYARQLQREEK